jgi:CrcB protein
MNPILLVGLGGFVGSVTRYKLSGLILHHTLNGRFPAGTFVVNILGCLVIGVLAGVIEKRHIFPREIQLLLITGFLGGFTTFSAFGLETIALLRQGAVAIATAYVAMSVIGGLACVWLGLRLGEIGAG